MKNLDEISVEEILREINLNLINNDFEVILNRDRDALNELNELLDKNKQQAQTYSNQSTNKTKGMQGFLQNERNIAAILAQLNKNAVETILKKYASVVNKEYLILINTYNSQHRLETEGEALSPELKAIIKKDVEKGLRLLAKRNCSVAIPVYDEESQLFTKLKVINSEELARNIKNGTKLNATNTMSRKKFDRINEIERRVTITNLVQAVSDEDIMYIVASDPEIGKGMIYQTAWNSMIRYYNAHLDKDIDIFSYMATEEMQRKTRKSHEGITSTEETLIRNCKYIDIDNLLLIAAYRYIEMLENDSDDTLYVERLDGEKIEENSKEESVRILHKVLECIRREIAKGTEIDVLFEEEGTRVKYSIEELERDLKRFRDGRYIRKADTQRIREKLLSNELKLSEVDQYELGFMNFTEREIHDLFIASEDNIIYAIDTILPKDETVYQTIYDIGRCSVKLFSDILDRNLLTAVQIINLFNRGIIKTEHIEQIKDERLIKGISQISMEMLKVLYLNISDESKQPKPEFIELFNRYRALYKEICIDGRSEEELQKNSSDFISSFDDEIDSNKLEGLYQYGLISLEAAADWGVNLTSMLSKNSIKPTDLKNLYANGIITIEAIRNVIINTKLPYEEKLDLIYSTFDGESEEEYNLREELVGLLETGEGYRAQGEKSNIIKNSEIAVKSRKFVTDPHARWKLISLLDKEYSKKFLPAGKEVIDGHRVFLLPNQDRIVIEKMHEKRHGRKVSAYASATYLMETDEFFRNMDDLIIDGAINRTALRELSEDGRATKIIHSTSWGNKIKEYFDIEQENERYTEDEISEINKAIENVSKSRRERE